MEIEKLNLYKDIKNFVSVVTQNVFHFIPMALEQDLIILCISFFPVKGAL